MILDIGHAIAEMMKNDCADCGKFCTKELEEECWIRIETIMISILKLKGENKCLKI